MQVSEVSLGDLRLGSPSRGERRFFSGEQAARIIETAKEPFRTVFTLAWLTALRAGELLALTKEDLDFTRKTIRVNSSADDNTREIHQTKTEYSTAFLPMPTMLEGTLRNYLEHHWKSNVDGFLFPAPRKIGYPRSRDTVVRCHLKPILRKLSIPDEDTGLHAFRHGLATELAESSVPLKDLQKQMRHADVRTTLRVYAHAIPETQRQAMEQVGDVLAKVSPIGTDVPIGTEMSSETVCSE